MSNRPRTLTLAHRAARTGKHTPFMPTTRGGRVKTTTTTNTIKSGRRNV